MYTPIVYQNLNYRQAGHLRLETGRLRLALSLLAGLGLWFAPAPRASAFAAAVAIIQDATDAVKWPRELQQWNRVVTELRRQTTELKELSRLTGSASKENPSVVGSVSSVLDPTRCALALKGREAAQAEGREGFGIARTGRSTIRAEDRVETTFTVLGETHRRDDRRYDGFAGQAALLARQDEALRLLRDVEQAEFAQQKRLLERLRSSRNQAEVAAVQAALTASQQRCSLAANKAAQARDESLRFASQRRLEEERRLEADREWTEALADRLRLRALASLHAQRGENN